MNDSIFRVKCKKIEIGIRNRDGSSVLFVFYYVNIAKEFSVFSIYSPINFTQFIPIYRDEAI